MEQFKVTEDTKAIDILTAIAQQKGPVEMNFKFQGIEFTVASELKHINGGAVKTAQN